MQWVARGKQCSGEFIRRKVLQLIDNQLITLKLANKFAAT